MPLSCCRKLVRLTRKHDTLIISDDIYDDMLQWSIFHDSTSEHVAPLPRLVDIDRSLSPLPSDPYQSRNALSNGSLSEIVALGVRTSWIKANPALTVALATCESTRAGGCSSCLVAAIIARSCVAAFSIRTLVVGSYRRIGSGGGSWFEAIENYPLGMELTRIGLADQYRVGGYFLWIKLPNGVASSEVAE